MAIFCNSCGKEMGEGTAFCNECGSPVVTSTATLQQPVQPEKTPKLQQQPAHANEKATVVSTGYFFGIVILYAIPIIGWIACLITAFGSKNHNKKNFAKAMLIWFVVGLVLGIAVYLVTLAFGGTMMEYLELTSYM